MEKYNIVRFYMDDVPPRVIKRGVTLEQAREHCRDPETSSETCVKKPGLAHTAQYGVWFDGYEASK